MHSPESGIDDAQVLSSLEMGIKRLGDRRKLYLAIEALVSSASELGDTQATSALEQSTQNNAVNSPSTSTARSTPGSAPSTSTARSTPGSARRLLLTNPDVRVLLLLD